MDGGASMDVELAFCNLAPSVDFDLGDVATAAAG